MRNVIISAVRSVYLEDSGTRTYHVSFRSFGWNLHRTEDNRIIGCLRSHE